MAKLYYCAECGTRLNVALKAIKDHAIIRIVEHHTCPDEPVEFDLEPVERAAYVPEKGEKNEFVQKLNNLSSEQRNIPTPEMKDRRPADQVKSEAPSTVLDQIKNMQHTEPAKDISEEPQE